MTDKITTDLAKAFIEAQGYGPAKQWVRTERCKMSDGSIVREFKNRATHHQIRVTERADGQMVSMPLTDMRSLQELITPVPVAQRPSSETGCHLLLHVAQFMDSPIAEWRVLQDVEGDWMFENEKARLRVQVQDRGEYGYTIKAMPNGMMIMLERNRQLASPELRAERRSF